MIWSSITSSRVKCKTIMRVHLLFQSQYSTTVCEDNVLAGLITLQEQNRFSLSRSARLLKSCPSSTEDIIS